MKLYYWRNGNDEVDFILEYKNKTIAIEVKSGNRLKFSGLEKANQQFDFYKTILVGVEGLDWKKFIRLDLRNLF
jgi:predicted AAA+ superfamily ATPase